MSEKFLNADDVKQLTGACSRKKQIQQLVANRLVFFINARGWPIVPLTAIANAVQPSQVAAAWQPNFAQLKYGQKKN